MQTSLETIQEFLACKRIAMVGLSRDPAHFSAKLFEEMCRYGYDMVPVNPKANVIHGKRCFACIQDVFPPVEAALLMTSPAVTGTVVHDCIEAGIELIWMYRAGGKGAVNEPAVQFCFAQGIQVIPGECPFMFLPESAAIHRLHGFVRKISGRYPQSRDPHTLALR
jgi:O-acetylhomoserine (thiol)-lyase